VTGIGPESGGLTGADAVLDAGVRAVAGFQELQGSFAGWGVGGDDLVSHAVDGVEQPQLGAGVWSFAAGDQPCSGRETAGVDQAGDLADFGAVTVACSIYAHQRHAVAPAPPSTDTCHTIEPAASATACNAVRIRTQPSSCCDRRNNAYAAAREP
jgi:hypothetical protein